MPEAVLIRPEVAMYAAFARLNYKPWYALAEFVDNSLQSALSNMEALVLAARGAYRLLVKIDIGEEMIVVRDTAAGIKLSDYGRAFLPASPPPDTTGLSEYGLGMKAAASWFAKEWSVCTTALGEPVERTITFDIPRIVELKCERLEPSERTVAAGLHYTVVTLRNLSVRPRGRTIAKIRDHLRSIYRLFLRDGILELQLNGEPLNYEPPQILEVPYYATPSADPLTWSKDIEVDLGDGYRVRGWAAILARASVANAGFAIFRRRRLIQGSSGEGYRPEIIFGKPNKFVYQRLVGELQVEDFSVSHTKDGIQWDDWEDDILEHIKRELDADPMPLLDQAANYRARGNDRRDIITDAARDAAFSMAQHLPPVADDQINAGPDESPLLRELERAQEEPVASSRIELDLEHAHRHWSVTIQLIHDASRNDWYELSGDSVGIESGEIQIRVNLAHPFMVRFVSPDGDEVIPFTRLASGLAIAEITAREVGALAGTIRRNLNQILRRALSGPIQRGEIRNGS